MSPPARPAAVAIDLAAQRTAPPAIAEITATILDVPTLRRHRLSATEVSHQSYVHVAMRLDDGSTGHGEAATLGGPRWAEESVESIKSVIDCYLAPALAGRPACAFEGNALAMASAAKRNYAAKAAVESAALDAVGRSLGLPAAALLGGAVRDRFPVYWTLASGDPAQEVEEAQDLLRADTFRRFKVKLGFAEPAVDIERLQTLRAALGEAVPMVVDINQAWSEAVLMRWLPAFAELQIGALEQPLPAAQSANMARLAARSPVPFMLDEGVVTEADAARAGCEGAGTILSLKLVKHGGAFALKRVAAVAQAHGIDLYGGCLLESSLGAAAHLAVFATLPSLSWGTEHFGPRILQADPVQVPLRYEAGEVLLPDGPGLGVSPDPERVRRFARPA